MLWFPAATTAVTPGGSTCSSLRAWGTSARPTRERSFAGSSTPTIPPRLMLATSILLAWLDHPVETAQHGEVGDVPIGVGHPDRPQPRTGCNADDADAVVDRSSEPADHRAVAVHGRPRLLPLPWTQFRPPTTLRSRVLGVGSPRRGWRCRRRCVRSTPSILAVGLSSPPTRRTAAFTACGRLVERWRGPRRGWTRTRRPLPPIPPRHPRATGSPVGWSGRRRNRRLQARPGSVRHHQLSLPLPGRGPPSQGPRTTWCLRLLPLAPPPPTCSRTRLRQPRVPASSPRSCPPYDGRRHRPIGAATYLAARCHLHSADEPSWDGSGEGGGR